MIKTKQNLKKNTATSDTAVGLLFLGSLVLIVWGINIYRLTLIPTKYLVIAVLLGTIITFPILMFGLKPSYKSIWIWLTSLVIGGGIFYFLFLYLNQKYCEHEMFQEEVNIVETGTLGKGKSSPCRSPYAVIDFDGVEKELVFGCDYEKTISVFRRVRLDYSKGLFGFQIIKTQTLLK